MTDKWRTKHAHRKYLKLRNKDNKDVYKGEESKHDRSNAKVNIIGNSKRIENQEDIHKSTWTIPGRKETNCPHTDPG